MTFEEFKENKDFEEMNSYLLRETGWTCDDINKLFNVTDWEEYTECQSPRIAMDNLWTDTYIRKKKRYTHYR